MPVYTLKPAPSGAPGGGSGGQRNFEAIPEDEIVHVEVVEIKEEEKPEKWRNGEYDTHRMSYHFKVVEGKYANRHLWGSTSTYFSKDPRCKFRIWIQEILGLDVLPVDFQLNTDDLVGAQVRVLVGNRTKADGTTTDFAKDLLRENRGFSSAPTPDEEVF